MLLAMDRSVRESGRSHSSKARARQHRRLLLPRQANGDSQGCEGVHVSFAVDML